MSCDCKFKVIGIVAIVQLSAAFHATGTERADFSIKSNPGEAVVSFGFDAAGYSDWWYWGATD